MREGRRVERMDRRAYSEREKEGVRESYGVGLF